ncbi:TPA: hypothetical protein JBC26_15845 [Legionella pneumophila subsp. pneumophila]|nr:hypothetical protein [Legionella pneumophila subsp. pneumophila]HAT9259151.1 hypothetical protein [Legionella pneumophila subsp. pneumophila]
MKLERQCCHCGRAFSVHRNPKQSYCDQPSCQQIRKNRWRKEKLKQDADYRSNQSKANQLWQHKNPDYWRAYRTSHPDYVSRNREKQRIRDKGSGEEVKASHLAKSDALGGESLIQSGLYRITPLDRDLAKSDAFTVKIALVSTGFYRSSDLAKRPLYIQPD